MNEPQIAFLALYLIYIAIILLFHNTLFMYPFRLLTTFLHELSHAIACWISCGSVRAIRVYENEGGVTSYVGGCRVLIIPAGYVGAAIWGSIFVMLSGGRKTATGAAGALIAMLLISLCFAPNRTMVMLNLCYVVVTSIFIYLEWAVFTPILNFIVLFYGAFVGIHAIFDTYQDTIRRTVLRSDAYACYEICPCCMPRCVGLQWAICNIVLQLGGIWIAMVQLSDECENMGWWDCISGDGNWGDNNFWDWEEGVANSLEDWLHW
mmetsp:Transcript_10204/g.22691  ORF Transcript_10204/g.22691 Transcript_10204/m.22691 type:complete len:264 (-) Transcript_10204:2599-3390(-)